MRFVEPDNDACPPLKTHLCIAPYLRGYLHLIDLSPRTLRRVTTYRVAASQSYRGA